LDELILVDNNSTDHTVEICEKFVTNYPKKVKFYHYTPDVLHYGLKRSHPHTSPHSLAYYYNRCFSKTTKSHVMKVDDDNIALPKIYTRLIEKIIRENKAGFYTTRGLNIFQKDGKL
jgi:glycosyltransferase involved in cell wall biosynthesis